MKEQKNRCDEIISSKDKLINGYQQEIKTKEDKYVKALQKQSEEIDDLIKRTRKQFEELLVAYEGELATVEDAFLEERKLLRQKNAEELEALAEERRNKEVYELGSLQC